jgi:CDP-glucose 4,6-dehydratase
VTSAWHHSYLARKGIGAATIRAGNIFGGGDWASDRLVPDAIRNFVDDHPLVLRHPEATRPWQHVLDPLPGYLALAERLSAEPVEFSGGWNFGPSLDDCRPVGDLAHLLAEAWGDNAEVRCEGGDGIFEEGLLALDSSKSRQRLGWLPRWPLEIAVDRAIAWYRAFGRGDDMWLFTQDQIVDFEATGKVAA